MCDKEMDSSKQSGADSVGSLTARSNALERVSDAVLSIDKNNRYTYVNERAAEILGVDPEAVLGEHIWDGFPPRRELNYRVLSSDRPGSTKTMSSSGTIPS